MHFRTGWMLAVVVNFVVGSLAVAALHSPIDNLRKYSLGVGCDFIDGEWYCETGAGAGLATLIVGLAAIAGSLAVVLIVVALITKREQRFRLARDLRLAGGVVAILALPADYFFGWPSLAATVLHIVLIVLLFGTLKLQNRTWLLASVGAAIAGFAYIGSQTWLGFPVTVILAFLVASAVATLIATPRRTDEPSTGLVAILTTAGA